MCSVLFYFMEWLFMLAPESRGMSGIFFFSSMHSVSAQLVFSEENPIFAHSAASPCLQAPRNLLRMMHQFPEHQYRHYGWSSFTVFYLLCGKRFHQHMQSFFLGLLGECRCCDGSSRTCRWCRVGLRTS